MTGRSRLGVPFEVLDNRLAARAVGRGAVLGLWDWLTGFVFLACIYQLTAIDLDGRRKPFLDFGDALDVSAAV